MAEMKVKTDCRPKKDGSVQVVITYQHSKFGTGIYCMNGETFTNGSFVGKGTLVKSKNTALMDIVTKINVAMLDYQRQNGRQPDESEWLSMCRASRNEDQSRQYLIDYFDEFQSTKKKQTANIYRRTQDKVREYDATATLDCINRAWLLGFQSFLRNKGLAVNGIGVHLRNVRAVINYCIDNEYTNKYAFRKFKIKVAQTEHRALTVEQIRTLMHYPVESHQVKFRDVFMLMFYLIGINGIDLFNLTWDDYYDGRIHYVRAKTNRRYSIKVEAEAMDIIKRYRGEKHILCFADEWVASNFFHRMCIELGRIGPFDRVGRGGKKVFHPLFPGLTPYWGRHTWATLAYEIGITRDVIGQSLGHAEWDSSTTDIYIKKDLSKIDLANRRVIDYVTSKT